MADMKNVELNDAAMSDAAGGMAGLPGPKYDIGQQIRFNFVGDDTTITPTTAVVDDRKHEAKEWNYLLRFEVNQTVYERWYPESVI
ncbi:MAG: hypothetical protein K6G27_07115 [Lachnospiraceae bacterium]|nr:hypothetical protein [Lachnospiraceae bacterium]